jgi:monovalent cation:H+ antiporter-2, CPA2 family
VLRKVKVPFQVLELNPDVVREASELGEPVHYGDSTRREVLHSVGLEHARPLVIAISDAIATRRTVALARELNPDIHIIVRTHLTNAFSKKWLNMRYAIALYFAYYNFCRVHSTLRVTPAMEAGLTNHVWTLKELLS